MQTYRSFLGFSSTLAENRDNAMDVLADEAAFTKLVREGFNGKAADFEYAFDVVLRELHTTKRKILAERCINE